MRHPPARRAAIRWSRSENRRDAGRLRTRTRPCREASRPAAGAGRGVRAPPLTVTPTDSFAADRGSLALRVTVAYHTGWHARQYKSTAPRLRGTVHCGSARHEGGVKLVTNDIQLTLSRGWAQASPLIS